MTIVVNFAFVVWCAVLAYVGTRFAFYRWIRPRIAPNLERLERERAK